METRRYKIVYCTPALYSAGGVERVVSVKANYFADVYGYDVTIIVTEGRERECFFPLSDKVKVINLQLGFEELWHASFLKKIVLYLIKQHKYKKRLTTELLQLHPDVTISVLRREINFINTIPDGSIKVGELHVNRSNYRNFASRDSNIVKRLFAHYWMNNLIGHLKKLDCMVVLTKAAKNDWPELTNVTLIPDPLPFSVNSVSPLCNKRVISIGRYAYEKGNDLLLRAWARVQNECDEWLLDIYGMGEQKPYRQLMGDIGIDCQRCRLHGSLVDVKEVYLNSAIFALPSRFEGFGLVLVEAMASGVPVISFDCENGPRNIITNGIDGYLIRPFDVVAYADRLISLIKDANLRKRVGAEARQTSLQYKIDDVALRWKTLFDNMVDK